MSAPEKPPSSSCWAKEQDSPLPRRIFNDVLDLVSATGHGVAFDSNCGSPQAKALIEQRATKLGALVFWLLVDPPEEYIINKLRSHPPTWLFENGEQAVERYYYRKATNPRAEFEFFYRFDPSKADLPQQVERCVALIRQEVERAKANSVV
jgi:hypothetical protein